MLNVLFWVCPILYSAPKDPVFYKIYYINPLAGILSGYRSVLWAGKAPDAYSFGLATAGTLVLGVIGVWAFWRYEREFADLI